MICQFYWIREEFEAVEAGDFITYSGWEVRDSRDKNVAAWDFKPVKGD